MSKEDIIELLLDNQAIIIEAAELSIYKVLNAEPEFEEEAKIQYIDNIKKDLLIELYNKGLTYEDVHAKIGEEELNKFIEKVIKHAGD